MTEKDLVIMSLGGSIIVPDEVDVAFLKKFRDLILKQIEKGKRFIIITGGGKTCRKYQQAAAKITKLTDEDLDWLGIHATRFNAHLLRTIFRKQAHPRVIKNPTEKMDFKEDILIGAGWRPGCSTDWDSVMIADNFKARKLINLSNIKYVCDKDPKFCRDAKPIPEMNWKEFRDIVGDKWDPGANLPFDPVASKEAEKLGLEVAIMDGTDLENLENYLEGGTFKGTVIKN